MHNHLAKCIMIMPTPAGNRTRGVRLEGEHVTTTPLV